MRSCLTILLMTLAASARGQEISVPVRPVDFVLDQTRTVTAAERTAIKAEMEKAEEETGLGVYVVLLNSPPEEPPLDLARRLAQGWREGADRVVIMSGPEMSPPLVIALAGELVKTAPADQIQAMTDAALAAGAKAGHGLPALLEAARSVISQVAVYRGGGVLGPPAPPPPPAAAGENSYLAAWIAGASLLCCIVAWLLMRRRRRSALIFPQTEFRQRFSAPHSGGNDAMVFFGKGEGQ